MGEFVTLAVEEGVATVTLNRPAVGNALNRDLLLDLKERLQTVRADEGIDVVILTGAGRMFCTGEDLRGLAAPDRIFGQVTLAMETLELVRKIPQPTIAAINGHAVTGGVEIALNCDLRIAAEEATFAVNQARMGPPGAGASQLLPRLVGSAWAKELLFTGDFISAADALRIGLINRVVPPERLLDEARGIAKRIQKNDQYLVRLIKQMVDQGLAGDLGAGLILERSVSQAYVLSKAKTLGEHAMVVRESNRAAMPQG